MHRKLTQQERNRRISEGLRLAWKCGKQRHMKDAERILALEYERDLLYNLLQKHRRFHDKAGCPGNPECAVCIGEDQFSFMLENGIGPDEMLLPTKIELTGEP